MVKTFIHFKGSPLARWVAFFFIILPLQSFAFIFKGKKNDSYGTAYKHGLKMYFTLINCPSLATQHYSKFVKKYEQ